MHNALLLHRNHTTRGESLSDFYLTDVRKSDVRCGQKLRVTVAKKLIKSKNPSDEYEILDEHTDVSLVGSQYVPGSSEEDDIPIEKDPDFHTRRVHLEQHYEIALRRGKVYSMVPQCRRTFEDA